MRNLVLAIILVLAALGSTHAQTANPAASITAPSVRRPRRPIQTRPIPH